MAPLGGAQGETYSGQIDYQTALFNERISSYLAVIQANYLGHAECSAAVRGRMQELAEATSSGPPLDVLDLGCGDGCTLRDMLPQVLSDRVASYTGVDLSGTMLALHPLAPLAGATTGGSPAAAAASSCGYAPPAVDVPRDCRVSLVEGDLLEFVEGGGGGGALHGCDGGGSVQDSCGGGGGEGGRAEGEKCAATYDLVLSALAVHHLNREQKFQLLAAMPSRLKPGGVFVMVDVVRTGGETREAWVQRFATDIRTRYTVLSPEQRDDIVSHMSHSDYPEPAEDWACIGKQAGFRTVRELGCSDCGFIHVFSFEQ